MQNRQFTKRRKLLKLTTLSILGLAAPKYSFATFKEVKNELNGPASKHFPNIDPEIISQVVGKSHSDLETVKKIVDRRPELSRSVWEWRFGDFESAIGAASHVGRRDIVEYLISKGGRPTIFTFAMMGNFAVVKQVVNAYPGIQQTMGPHGISLLDHAYAGERMKDKMSKEAILNQEKTIDFLEALGNAKGDQYLEVSEAEKDSYLGKYMYGEGEDEGFSIQLNMRKMLSIAPIGGFGGAIYKVAEQSFIYNGSPSVKITFDKDEQIVTSLKVETPEEQVLATKV